MKDFEHFKEKCRRALDGIATSSSGYGRLYVHPEGKVWFTTWDGDDEDYVNKIKDILQKIAGEDNVTVEAEIGPEYDTSSNKEDWEEITLKYAKSALLGRLNRLAADMENIKLYDEATIVHNVFMRVAEIEGLLKNKDAIEAEMTLKDALDHYDSDLYRVDPKGNWDPKEWMTIQEFIESLPEGSLSAPAAIDANHIAFDLPEVGFQVLNMVPRSEWGKQPGGNHKGIAEEDRKAIQDAMKKAAQIGDFECYFNPQTKKLFLLADDLADNEKIEAIAAIMSECDAVKKVDWGCEASPGDKFIHIKHPEAKESHTSMSKSTASTFRKELQNLINSLGKDNSSDTPDFILAEYLNDCLEAFDKALLRRKEWYDEEDSVTFVFDKLVKSAQIADQHNRYALADFIDGLSAKLAKNHGGLDDWFKNEHWVDLRRPKKEGGYEPCGRNDSSKGKKPVCTPANKAKELSDKERKERIRQKAKQERKPGKGKKPKTTTYTDAAGGKSNISTTRITALLKLAQVCDSKEMHRIADQAMNCALAMYRYANEWWIKDGVAVYADGDYGDVNHEMLAEEEMLNRLGFDFEHYDEGPLTRDYASHLLRRHIKDLDDYNSHLRKIYGDDEEAIAEAHQEADLYEYLLWKRLHENPKMNPDQAKQEMDEAWKGFRDPRTYALKNFGWHRVNGNRIETYNMNENVLQEIAQGLYDAYGEDAETMHFYIESHNPQKYIGPVTLYDIESGKVLRDVIGPDAMSDVNVSRPPGNSYYKYDGD